MSAHTLDKGGERAFLGEHEYFTRLHSSLRHDVPAQLVELVFDAGHGLRVCTELLSSDDFRRQNGDVPVLGVNDTSDMLRFLAATARLLVNQAERCMDHMNSQAEREGV